jgi:hypothetical protein
MLNIWVISHADTNDDDNDGIDNLLEIINIKDTICNPKNKNTDIISVLGLNRYTKHRM